MVLTIKIFKNIYYKKQDHETINEFNYILPDPRVVLTYNTVH
jgi:hypothetical protein